MSIVQTLQRVRGRGLLLQPPKSAKGRRLLSLSADTVAELRKHRAYQAERRLAIGSIWQDSDLVFPGEFGGPLDPSVLTHAFVRIVRQGGMTSVRLHDLRHFHATLLLQQNTHPKIVQERLGHSSIAITLDTYSHVVPGLQERAAESFAEAMEQERTEAESI